MRCDPHGVWSSPRRSPRFLPSPGAVTALAGGAVSAHFGTSPCLHFLPQSLALSHRQIPRPDGRWPSSVTRTIGLVFISLWARATATVQNFCPPHLSRDEQGLDQFHLITERGANIWSSSAAENLESAARLRHALFGSLTNIWLFDRRCVK